MSNRSVIEDVESVGCKKKPYIHTIFLRRCRTFLFYRLKRLSFYAEIVFIDYTE